MYGKLFSSMYDGTLATKGPWEALVTFQQFVVLSDRFGVVDMTPEAISRRTTIPLEVIAKGISVLEAPDVDSRRPDEDGRRIVRIDERRTWGWRIVNFEHYRNMKRAQDRNEYQRDLMRARRAKPDHTVGTRGATVDAAFDAFYAAYPKKVARPAAERAWRAAKIDNGQVAKVMAALEAHKASEQWQREAGRFIPNPATWLNGRRWNDEAGAAQAPQFPV